MDGFIFYTDGSVGRYKLNFGTSGFIGYKFTEGQTSFQLPRGLSVTDKGFVNLTTEKEANKVKVEEFYTFGIKREYPFSYLAEINAILEAIKCAKERAKEKDIILIKTDCEAAIIKINNLLKEYNETDNKFPEILEIVKSIKELASNKISVSFKFTPGHSGVYGNEFIDRLCSLTYNKEFISKENFKVIKPGELTGKLALPFFLNQEVMYKLEKDNLYTFYTIKEDSIDKSSCYQMSISLEKELAETKNDIASKNYIKLFNAIDNYRDYPKSLVFYPKSIQTFDNLLFSKVFENIYVFAEVNKEIRMADRTLFSNGCFIPKNISTAIKDNLVGVKETYETLNGDGIHFKVDITEEVKNKIKKNNKNVKVELGNELPLDAILLDYKSDFTSIAFLKNFIAYKDKFKLFLLLKKETKFVRYALELKIEGLVTVILMNKYTNIVYPKK